MNFGEIGEGWILGKWLKLSMLWAIRVSPEIRLIFLCRFMCSCLWFWHGSSSLLFWIQKQKWGHLLTRGKLTWYNVGNYIWLSSLSVGASLGSSVFPHWWPFLFLWYQLYYIINIGQSQYQDYRRSGRAIICAEYQIYRTFAYTPGIGNEGGMCWECSLLSVSTPLRSGKDNSTNGINNFFSAICGFLKHNLGYNFIKNADIQGFCS